jgi:cytosine/adenosine deaminase-related metal-dependent hydrolase
VGTDSLASGVINFHEVIGFSRARANSALQSLVERLGIDQGTVDGSKIGISPHAPYTVSQSLVKDLVSLACKHHLPMAMHLAESRDELELLKNGTGPFKALLEERSMWDSEAIPRASRPLDYLQILAAAPRTLVVHGNYLDEEELGFVAHKRERMSLVYCPRTHAYFGHSSYPLHHALSRGVRVALGTDSRASNPDLSLLSEMRHVFRTHPEIDPNTVLHMGTLAGAEALGGENFIGTITADKTANLIAVPIPENANGSPDDLLAAILADDSPASVVYLSGRRL